MAEGEEEKIVVGAGGDEEKIIVGAGGSEEEKQIVLVGAGSVNDEEKKIVLVGAGDEGEIRNDGRVFPPPGFRFKPRHDELVMYYLLPKLQGREHVPNDKIIEDNVYQCHPEKLIDKYRSRGEDSWYFLSPRARKYQNGNRPSRSTDDKSGRWKASTGKKKKQVSEDGGGGKTTKSGPSKVLKVAGEGKTEYLKSTLVYFQGPIKGEKKSKWLMKELTIPEYEKKRSKNGGGGNDKDMLDKYVMCRIYETNRQKGDDDEAGPSGTQSEPAVSGQATTVGHAFAKLSKKQAGKRPAVEQPASKRARHHSPDRLHLGPPAPPLHGNAVQASFRAPGYCGGGPGWPMGYHARVPMPRPPLAYHDGQPAFNGLGQVPRQPMAYNSQVQVPRQQVANNGQVPVPRQQVANNGQVPVPWQQVANNGQVPVPRQQQVAYNSQMTRAPVLKPSPPFGPAGTHSSDGQNQKQTMMSRPPYPAGQAVNPPSSVVPRPAQAQKQPETEDMRERRVYRQHIEELNRFRQISTRPPASAAHAAQLQGPTAFTHQQQRPTVFTHQQQRPMMASTQQQQRPTAFTHQQQASTQQQQRPMMASTQQQQRPMMAFAQHQHEQERPYFGGSAYHYHHAGAMSHGFSLENFNASEAAQDYQSSPSFLPATSCSAGASAGSMVSSVVSGAGGAVNRANRDHSNDVNMEFVEPATDGGNASAADGDGHKYDSAPPPQ